MLPGEWMFLIALPSARIAHSVQAGDLALVPRESLSDINLLEPERIAAYLSQFKTPFGDALQPSALLGRVGVTRSADNMAHLRNSVAVAAVVRARAWTAAHEIAEQPKFTDAFDFARIGLRLSPGLIVETPGVMGLHSIEETFSGQGTPVYPYAPEAGEAKPDALLLEALIEMINAQPRARAQRERRAQLLRSVEVAAHAMRAPSYGLGSEMDRGVPLALWVSAFETLVNRAGAVSFPDVRAAIDAVPWISKALLGPAVRHDYRSPWKRAAAIAKAGEKVPPDPAAVREAGRGFPVSRPVHVYSRLYRARNAMMHGELLGAGGVEPGRRKTWGPLALQAAAVYRCVLLYEAAKAGYGKYPRPPDDLKPPWTGEQFVEHMVAWRDAGFAHDSYEKALARNYAAPP